MRVIHGVVQHPTIRCNHCSLVRCYHPEVPSCEECLARINTELKAIWDKRHNITPTTNESGVDSLWCP